MIARVPDFEEGGPSENVRWVNGCALPNCRLPSNRCFSNQEESTTGIDVIVGSIPIILERKRGTRFFLKERGTAPINCIHSLKKRGRIGVARQAD